MSLVAIICDVHNGAKNDAPNLRDMMRDFYQHIFFPTLDKHHITEVFNLGDVFERRRYCNAATLEFYRREYRKEMASREIFEHILLGNHDIYYNDSSDVSIVAEICDNAPFTRVYRDITDVIAVGGRRILLVPWLPQGYTPEVKNRIQRASASVVLGHLELAGFPMYRGMEPCEQGESVETFEKFELVLSGHYHHASTYGAIHYIGSPFHLTWNDYGDDRGFYLLDTDTLEMTFIKNTYSRFKKVVYNDVTNTVDDIKALCAAILEDGSSYHDAYVKVVVEQRTRGYWFEMVMDALNRVGAQDIIVVDDILVGNDPTADSQQPLKTLDVIQNYIDQLEINCDKTALQQYATEIYRAAIETTHSTRVN